MRWIAVQPLYLSILHILIEQSHGFLCHVITAIHHLATGAVYPPKRRLVAVWSNYPFSTKPTAPSLELDTQQSSETPPDSPLLVFEVNRIRKSQTISCCSARAHDKQLPSVFRICIVLNMLLHLRLPNNGEPCQKSIYIRRILSKNEGNVWCNYR